MKNLFDLTDKYAIVTGAGRGLGRAMAIGLASAGAVVAATDIIDMKSTIDEIHKFEKRAFSLKVDVSQKADVDLMIQKVLKIFPHVDILINNAGILKMSPAETLKEDDWEKVLKVNLTGQYLCAQAVGKHMISQKSGSIINIASVAGLFGSAQSLAYGVSKAGVILMTKNLAVEWGKHNIRVNAICPGVFATDMTDEFLKNKQMWEPMKVSIPLGRYATADELVGTAVYLASDASAYITGHSLIIDGGWTAGL
jgi:NAD(P)-dependent dehydrogenase (short-subunit alcohol dehydrogenase family)